MLRTKQSKVNRTLRRLYLRDYQILYYSNSIHNQPTIIVTTKLHPYTTTTAPTSQGFHFILLLNHELKAYLSSLTNYQDLPFQKHHKTNQSLNTQQPCLS